MIREIEIRTKQRDEFIDVTELILEQVRSCDLEEGILHVYIPHTTAGITINDKMPNVSRDILIAMDNAYPIEGDYKHDAGNSPAHIKASLMGSSINVPFIEKKLLLGGWQRIYFCEFDGPKVRKMIFKVVI